MFTLYFFNVTLLNVTSTTPAIESHTHKSVLLYLKMKLTHYFEDSYAYNYLSIQHQINPEVQLSLHFQYVGNM